jgi:hypothetical protein
MGRLRLSDQGTRNPGEQGFVLVWVLGSIMLLASILTPFAIFARIHFMLAANVEESFRFDLLADGFSALALATLSGRGESGYPLLNGDQQACSIDGYTVLVSLQDHSGLIDLNGAPPELLALGFQAVGVEAQDAGGLAQTALAYRQVRSRSERTETTAVNLKHAPFEAVVELREFPRLREIPTRGLLDIFTVHARQGTVSRPLAQPALHGTLVNHREGEQLDSDALFLSGTITARVEIWSSDGKLLGFSERVVSLDFASGRVAELERRGRGTHTDGPNARTNLSQCGTLLGISTLG